jgi:hypothetical protein
VRQDDEMERCILGIGKEASERFYGSELIAEHRGGLNQYRNLKLAEQELEPEIEWNSRF